MQEHYDSKPPHTAGIAVEEPPAPATVENPPQIPMFGGRAIPPPIPESKTELAFQILLMKKSYRKAFYVWTAIVFALASMFISSLMLWVLFRI